MGECLCFLPSTVVSCGTEVIEMDSSCSRGSVCDSQRALGTGTLSGDRHPELVLPSPTVSPVASECPFLCLVMEMSIRLTSQGC